MYIRTYVYTYVCILSLCVCVALKLCSMHLMFLSPESMYVYDNLDEDVLRSYHEYSLASLLYYALKESAASELSARMTAMDGASKNAGMYISMHVIV